MTSHNLTRRNLCKLAAAGALASGTRTLAAEQARVKAFCIDFNWGPGGPNAFAGPGVYAKASPERHIRWYQEMSVNTIQTFCVSCIGYAWYKQSAVAPVMPDLASDFLPEITRLAHGSRMRSMGYFCVGANTHWGQMHPDLSQGIPAAPHIPFTNAYLDYLARSIRDALTKVDINGFMIDWVWNPKPKWMECEKQMYAELMGVRFPGEKDVAEAQVAEYGRRAVDRAWRTIHQATKSTRKDAILWLSCNNLKRPQIAGSRMLQECDWVMNEAPDPALIEDIRAQVGPKTMLIQDICGWGAKHDAAALIHDPRCKTEGFYGFARPDPVTTLPPEETTGNGRNIAIMRKEFRTL